MRRSSHNSMVPASLLFCIFVLLLWLSCAKDRDNPLDSVNFQEEDPYATTVRMDTSGVEVRWKAIDMSGITGYRIYRSEGEINADTLVGIVATGVTRYVDRHIWVGQKYYYRIAAIGSGGQESIPSSYDSILVGGGMLEVTPLQWQAPEQGGSSGHIRVGNSGNVGIFSFVISMDSSWIGVSKAAGSVPDSLRIEVPANYSEADRVGHVIVTASGIAGSPDTVTITQSFITGTKPIICLSQTSWKAPALGETSPNIAVKYRLGTVSHTM
jgi:hypothetical protein